MRLAGPLKPFRNPKSAHIPLSYLQQKYLMLLAEGNISGGVQGEEDSIENWFDRVTEKLMMEFTGLMRCAEKVLMPPPKGHGIQRQTIQGK